MHAAGEERALRVYRSSRESALPRSPFLVIVMAAVALDQVTKWCGVCTRQRRVINVLPTLEFDLSYNSGQLRHRVGVWAMDRSDRHRHVRLSGG